MKKKTDKKFSKFFKWVAIVAALITFAEGTIYYSSEKYTDTFLRVLLIIQNTIKAFSFRTDISLASVAASLASTENMMEVMIGKAYGVAIFLAPYCTLVFLYKWLERFLRIKNWKIFQWNKKGCIIFGYNEEVKALLKSKDKLDPKDVKYRIHVVASDVDEKDEFELLNQGVILHRVDCLKMEDDQLEYFLKQMELKYAETVILFEESSARNFSLYQMFRDFKPTKPSAVIPVNDIKFYLRCEEEGIRRIIEEYHAEILEKNEDEEKYIMEEVCADLEIISIPELRVRNILKKNPLHTYYLNKEKEHMLNPRTEWDLHLLIIGFGKLGQQFLLQAMNQGVVSSENKIIIDVIDANIDERRSVFANYFHESYIKEDADTGESEIMISEDEVNGELRVRFHKMDIRYREFYQQLVEFGNHMYTYVAICVEDEDLSLHCMSQVQRYLRNYDETDCEKYVPMAVRMEYDKKMAQFLNKNQKTYANIVAVEDTASTVTLEELLHGEIDAEAKRFNYIYHSLNVKSSSAKKTSAKEKPKSEADYWRTLALFRRNSSRALAYHQSVKRVRLGKVTYDQLKELVAELLNQDNNTWLYSEAEVEFAKKQSDAEVIGEFSKMEHRRWCYYMISCGWTRTKSIYDEKSDSKKQNPCICTWEDLSIHKPDMCKYDLLPLLVFVGNGKQKFDTKEN